MTQLIGLVQVLISKLPALPAGSPAGATAVFSLIYTYIRKWVSSSMLSKKSAQKFSWNLENYVANEILKLLACSTRSDR
jgi:hypothetical protein